jgi:1-acyl-sn-glycerol-3-phosphate acyltransferase
MDAVAFKDKEIAFRRKLIRGFTRPIMQTLFQIRVHGREHYPPAGPLLVVGNHFHWSEPGLLALSSPWDIEFLGARASVSAKWYGWFVRLYHAVPVERLGVNVDAIREVIALLRAGKVVGVFPEGRTHLGHLSDAWPGAAFLALKAKVPLLPVGVVGAWDAPSLWRSFRRAPVDIRVGEVFGPLQPPQGTDRKEVLDWATQEIMARIACLLPERMRGSF